MSSIKLPPDEMREIDQTFWAKIAQERRYRELYERQQKDSSGKK
jgi:hypothetical protein